MLPVNKGIFKSEKMMVIVFIKLAVELDSFRQKMIRSAYGDIQDQVQKPPSCSG